MVSVSEYFRTPHRRMKSTLYALTCLAFVSILYAANQVHDEISRYVAQSTSLRQIRNLLGTSEPSIDLVWLLGYPFTGAGATIRLIESGTGKSMATNYGNEVATKDGRTKTNQYPSVPIDSTLFPNGPFLHNTDLPGDSPVMMVHSHCSGFCLEEYGGCSEANFIDDLLDYKKWAKGCREGLKYDPKSNAAIKTPSYSTNKMLSKVIITARNPLEVIASRFKEHMVHDSYYETRGYGNRKGLKMYCEELDKAAMDVAGFKDVEKQEAILELSQNVICASEVIRMGLWYNNLMKLVTGMDYHIVYYEDFTNNYEEAMARILDFMGIEFTNDVSFQRTAPVYAWIETEEIPSIGKLLKEIASPRTWMLLGHYLAPFMTE